MDTDRSTADSSNLYKLLVEQLKDYAIFMLDRRGDVLSGNEGVRRLIGYDSNEIVGQHLSVFYPVPDIESEKPAFDLRMAQEMGRYETDAWRVRKDGSRFWANVIITPTKNSNGQLIGFSAVIRDVTENKMQEDNLQRLLDSEERFRLLVEQVKDYAIFILDPRGNISSWNQGARRLKGYTADEVIGKHFSIFYTPEDIARDHPTNELTIAVREGRYEEEGWRVRKDGTLFWASVVITALWDKRGNLTGFAKVTRDLTQRKKDEDALRQKTEELEAFAHTVSHDLRSPLRSLSSFAQILKEDGEEFSDAEKSEYLDKIFKSAHRMETLINDILRYTQVSISPAPEALVSLTEVVDEAIHLLQGEIDRTKAEITIKRPLTLVFGNRVLMVQIFTNLIGNGLKFVSKGERPKIEISTVGTNGKCEIHVRDFGIGIPQEYREVIFRMFERGPVHNEFSGSGVGLAIVKKAAEKLGGTISVTSQAGAGSDFVLTLRCDASSA